MPFDVQAHRINCRDERNIIKNMYLNGDMLIGNEDRFHQDGVMPYNMNIPTPTPTPQKNHQLVLNPIVSIAKESKLSDMLAMDPQLENNTNLEIMLLNHLFEISRIKGVSHSPCIPKQYVELIHLELDPFLSIK